MDKQNASNTDHEFLERVAKFLAEVEPEGLEEVRAALHEAGYDPEAIERQAIDLFDKLQSSSPFDWRNRSRSEIEAERIRVVARTANTKRQSRASYLEKIQQLAKELGGEGAQLVTAHRNFEEATEEDLASLLADLEYLAEKHGRRV